MRYVYAHICVECNHLGSGHLLDEDGDLRAGPYRCACGCEIPQDGPFIEFDRRGYEKWLAENTPVLNPTGGDHA